MQNINEEMRALLFDMNEHSRLKREVGSLEKQKSKLEDKLRDLKGILRHEQRDVDDLNRVTLQSVWLRICGTHEETLRREQADVDAAMLKCAAAQREIEEIDREIAARRRQLSNLAHSERRYNELLNQKRTLLSASPAGEKMRSLEEKAASLRSRQKELREAIDEGGAALHTAAEIIDCLKSADTFATVDLFTSSMLVDFAKHSEMNSAQRLIEELQRRLHRFRTELRDVQLDAGVPVDGFLSVADFIFDGLIADWTVKKRIGTALTQVQTTHQQIDRLLISLRAQLQQAKREEEDVLRLLDEAVREA